MGHFRKTVIAAGISLGMAGPLVTPAAAASFDGEWNVRIASANSVCGNGATISLSISNGRVASSGAMTSASGRVAEAGNISVTLASGEKHAVGVGHLSDTSGSGVWHGGICSGTWTARRI